MPLGGAHYAPNLFGPPNAFGRFSSPRGASSDGIADVRAPSGPARARRASADSAHRRHPLGNPPSKLGKAEMWLPPENRGPPQLVERSSAQERVCRCGTRIGVRGIAIEVVGLSGALPGLFEGQAFCSLRCVRAFFLETLSILDGLDTIEGETLISDLHATYAKLASAFATLVRERNLGYLPGERASHR